jgi:putative ABC transport system permease protein
MLRTRPGSFAGTFVMLAMTATIVAAAAQIMATALGAPGPGRFAAADAVVRANPTVKLGSGDNADSVDVQRAALLPADAVARVATVPGVRSAVGDVTFPLTVVGRDGAPLPTRGAAPAHAHGWPSAALTPYRLARGHAPTSSGEVVLDAGLARAGGFRVGERVRVMSPAGAEVLRLVGAAASRAQQERQSSVFLTQSRAQQLSGLGAGFNAIAVRGDPRTDGAQLRVKIRDALGGDPQVLDHRHASTADAGDTRAFDRVELVAVLASGGGITLAIVVFVVAGTIGFAVERRRREVALLRSVGATPGQVRRLLLGETALIGLVAGATGCVAATALFAPFTDALVSAGIAPDGFKVAPNWIPYAIALAVGVVVAVLATVVAARRALKVRPGEALVESAVPPRRMGVVRALLGVVALGGGLTLVIVLASQAVSFAILAAFCFMIAVALLGPLVIGWPAALAGRTLLAGGGSGFLAGSALQTGRFRVGAVGAAIALVVALAGTQAISLATADHATQHETADRVQAGHVLVARAGGGLPPTVAQAAAKLPGAGAAGMVSTDVFLLDRHLTNDGDSWDAAGLDPAAARAMLDLGVRAGSLDAVRGTGIAVSDTLAKDGAKIGSVVHARLADATPVCLRVVAVYRRANGLGDVVLARDLALAHASAALDSAVFVAGDARGLDAIVRAYPNAVVRSRAAYLDDVKAPAEDNARAQWVIVALMIAIAAMAAFNTGAMAAAERRRELVLARLGGATRRQVIGSLTLETIVTTLAGIAAGVAVALASLARVGDDPAGGPLVVPWGAGGRRRRGRGRAGAHRDARPRGARRPRPTYSAGRGAGIASPDHRRPARAQPRALGCTGRRSRPGRLLRLRRPHRRSCGPPGGRGVGGGRGDTEPERARCRAHPMPHRLRHDRPCPPRGTRDRRGLLSRLARQGGGSRQALRRRHRVGAGGCRGAPEHPARAFRHGVRDDGCDLLDRRYRRMDALRGCDAATRRAARDRRDPPAVRHGGGRRRAAAA